MVPRQQRALTRRPTPPHPFFLLAACFQQVPQEELLVPPQHPFWDDVSPYSRCVAACFLIWGGTAPDRGHRRSKAASEETALGTVHVSSDEAPYFLSRLLPFLKTPRLLDRGLEVQHGTVLASE